MTDEVISISKEDAQCIFDLALSMDGACSGYMETDDVKAMRRLAIALGIDPIEATPEEFVSQFPHKWKPGQPDVGAYRGWVRLDREDTEHANNISVRRPETDGEVIERVGPIPAYCIRGNGRCGALESDPIHQWMTEIAE